MDGVRRKMGWKPDKPDQRDKTYAAHRMSKESMLLPKEWDLRAKMPPVYDQGDFSSCTACAIAALLQYNRVKQGYSSFVPSRMFIYYNERFLINETKMDNGAEIRDGIKTVAEDGYVPETLWKYTPENLFTMPPVSLYNKALKTKAFDYYRLNNQNIIELKTCIANGFPFVFGYSLYERFEEADRRHGHVEMPGKNERLQGGHAVACVGYNDTTGYFVIRNSWGTDAGDKGYYYFPYAYLTDPNLSDDFWCIRKTTE